MSISDGSVVFWLCILSSNFVRKSMWEVNFLSPCMTENVYSIIILDLSLGIEFQVRNQNSEGKLRHFSIVLSFYYCCQEV